MSQKRSIVETHPHLVAEWHPTKNGSLVPSDFTSGSSRKIWWKCVQGDDHEWEAVLKNRANGASCAICTNKKAVKSNSLATLFPQVSSQWHLSKNSGLTPYDFVPGSHAKVWWKCQKGDDHEWIASIGERTLGKTNCPVCEGLKVVKSNCLETTHPEISKEWHVKKNKNCTPRDVVAGSSKKVWWKCPKDQGHVWQASINNRTSKNSGCPICTNQIVTKSNCLSTVYPELSKEWHPWKNLELTPFDVSSGSTKKVWWKCDKGDDHEWQARVVDRSGKAKNNCPVCSGRQLGKKNSLGFKYPEIATMWSYELNGEQKPEMVIANSHTSYWWKCSKGDDHIWKASPNALISNSKKVKSNGCPVCRGLKVVRSNSLAYLNPELSKEWHFELNSKTPESYSINSGMKVWWRCRNDPDHYWKSSISNRTNGSNCPFCDLTPQSRQELIITFELKTLFNRIDPKGYKTMLNNRLRAIDIYIPKLNLCIEFDGSYWHKDKGSIDKIKSEMLLKSGFKVIRVREEPLQKIHETDVISKKPYNGKKVTNEILSMITNMYELDEELLNRIKHYQSVGELQNEKGLNRYIANILREKSDRSTKSRTQSQNL